MLFPYLIAGLPHLKLGEKPPLTLDEFLFRTQHLLEPKHLADLQALREGRFDELATQPGRVWRDMDVQLRNVLAAGRAKVYGIDAKEAQRPVDAWDGMIRNAAEEALAAPNPLERELALDRLRWDACEELVRSEAFGFGAIFAFCIRLGLGERWSNLDEKAGFEALENIMSSHV
jgi:hypothetical protein